MYMEDIYWWITVVTEIAKKKVWIFFSFLFEVFLWASMKWKKGRWKFQIWCLSKESGSKNQKKVYLFFPIPLFFYFHQNLNWNKSCIMWFGRKRERKKSFKYKFLWKSLFQKQIGKYLIAFFQPTFFPNS